MKLKTVQSVAFKSTFEVLKDVLNDVNIYFTQDGIKLTTLDTARAALVDMFLEADKFEEYECKENCVAGINVTNIFKLLKSINANDCLEMSIRDQEFLHIKFENIQKKTSTVFRLKLLDINEDIIEIPQVTMSAITTLPSIDFQKICRDMNNLGDEVIISRRDNVLNIKCDGDFAQQDTSIEFEDDANFKGYVEGTYSLKYINMFTKATNMCSIVQIQQEEQNKFLILKYNIASLGEVKFYIATKADE